MEIDCGFTKENGWFRCRAAAIIIEDGYILFVKNSLDDYYYSVGGGIHLENHLLIQELFPLKAPLPFPLFNLSFILLLFEPLPSQLS